MTPSGSLDSEEPLLKWISVNSSRFVLSAKHRLLYVDVPKNASSAIKWWFAELLGISKAIRQETRVLRLDQDQKIHPLLRQFAPEVGMPGQESILRAVKNPDFLTFGFVRNPFQRMFSTWQNRILLPAPYILRMYNAEDFMTCPLDGPESISAGFELFLEHLFRKEFPHARDVHWAAQSFFLRVDLFPDMVVQRLEEPRDLIKRVSDRVPPGTPALLGGNRANSSLLPYERRFVSDRSAELIRRLHGIDFERFGYDPEPPDHGARLGDDVLAKAIQAFREMRSLYRNHALIRSHLQDELARKDRLISQLGETVTRFHNNGPVAG